MVLTCYPLMCMSDNYFSSWLEYLSLLAMASCAGLSRLDLVAMAVMLGCDYMPQGVPGVGKEMVMRVVREEREMVKIFQGGGMDLTGK